MRLIFLSFLLFGISCAQISNETILSYSEVLTRYCSPPFHYYKSWCYYVFPNLTSDWFTASRLCRSIDKQSSLVYIGSDDEMLDPLRDILINREKTLNIQSVWTNTSWGHQRRHLFSRQSKRLCRKIQLKSTLKSGHINVLRMPFSHCREKHHVMCRKEIPLNTICRRPWGLAYGICYYLNEQARSTPIDDEERNLLQCQAWEGELFFSSKDEKTTLLPFLSYSLHGLQSSSILPENFGGIAYSFENLIHKSCSLISGDVYLSSAMADLRKTNQTTRCSTFHSYTFCRQRQNTSCQPPWFLDDGFCLYFSSRQSFDMAGATIECARQGGSLLYINNEQELFRLIQSLLVLTPFFPSKSLAGVWLALSYRAAYAGLHEDDDNTTIRDPFQWQWDLNIESYLDHRWKTIEWTKFFQHRLSPLIVSAGDCAALIIDGQIREPIERTSCHYPRTVVCRKPLNYGERSFHQKHRYERFARLQNMTETIETPQKTNPTENSSLVVDRTVFELFNSTSYRWVIYTNGTSSIETHWILVCQSKGLLSEQILPSDYVSSIITFDVSIRNNVNDYDIFFNYLRSKHCRNSSTQQCYYLSCDSSDRWLYILKEMLNRWHSNRQQFALNQRCATKYGNAPNETQLCSLLVDQFRLSQEKIIAMPSVRRNNCEDYGGQCIPQSLINERSLPFFDAILNCSTGFICWFQGERCSSNGFCLDRLRFPCPSTSRLMNFSCSNQHHECCASRTTTPPMSSIISTESLTLSSWNIFVPIYYFSFSGISKWDRFFFDAWLRPVDKDLSADFINDEFLFQCQGIVLQPKLILTHQSCLPTRLTQNDKRSILFSFVNKDPSHPTDLDQYERVALNIETYQVYSPFQLIRLAYEHEFLVNKTSKRLNTDPLIYEKFSSLYCVLVVDEQQIRPIRLIDSFEQQLIFDEKKTLFTFLNETESIDDEWSFAPIFCIDHDWTLMGISGQQLQHQCRFFHEKKFCQMTLIYGTTWKFN